MNVGQKFFGFGWESMLLEAGFFAAFLGPMRMQPDIIPIADSALDAFPDGGGSGAD